VAPSCWNYWGTLTIPLRRPNVVQNLPSTWTYTLGVDCHRPLVVVLEPEWSNDAMFGDGNSGSALHRV